MSRWPKACHLVAGIALGALIPGLAYAQRDQTGESTLPVPNRLPTVQTPDQVAAVDIANRNAGGEEIVVTGTLIRGIAPAGNNVIGITSAQIAATGGVSTNQILNNLPQVANFFNALPAGVSGQSGANASNPISRPNVQKVDSAFGEPQVPLFGRQNETMLLREMTLSVSARYDKYRDFGDTFNQKVRATWRPVRWIAIHGNVGAAHASDPGQTVRSVRSAATSTSGRSSIT